MMRAMKNLMSVVPIAAAVVAAFAAPAVLAAQSSSRGTVSSSGITVVGSGDTVVTVIRRGDGKPDCTVRVGDRTITGSTATAACERATPASVWPDRALWILDSSARNATPGRNVSPDRPQRVFDSLFADFPSSSEPSRVAERAMALQLRALEESRNRNFTVPMVTALTSASKRAMIGVTTETRVRDTDQYGAYITAVTPGSPAAKIGLRAGDVITKVDGVDIGTGQAVSRTSETSTVASKLSEVVGALEPGKQVALEFRRGSTRYGRLITPIPTPPAEVSVRSIPGEFFGSIFADSVTVNGRFAPTFREAVTAVPPAISLAWTGSTRSVLRSAELAPMNEGLRSYFGTGTGVLVVNVPENQDENLGLLPGDVILEIGGRAVTTPVQFFRILSSYDRGEEVSFQVMRQKASRRLSTRIP